ncbi:hypothetical protein HGE68_02465 [Rhodobacteraceae bacterium R_SAG6]|nr:hypothetical protein [Rhodobacteraceae bacterium R_SAG6]
MGRAGWQDADRACRTGVSDQQIDLGESVWTGEGVVPQVVKVGWSPDIGPGNEADYSDSIGTAP